MEDSEPHKFLSAELEGALEDRGDRTDNHEGLGGAAGAGDDKEKINKLKKLLQMAKKGLEASQLQNKQKDAELKRLTSRVTELEQNQKKASEGKRITGVRARVSVDNSVWCYVALDAGETEWRRQENLFADASMLSAGFKLPKVVAVETVADKKATKAGKSKKEDAPKDTEADKQKAHEKEKEKETEAAPAAAPPPISDFWDELESPEEPSSLPPPSLKSLSINPLSLQSSLSLKSSFSLPKPLTSLTQMLQRSSSSSSAISSSSSSASSSASSSSSSSVSSSLPSSSSTDLPPSSPLPSINLTYDSTLSHHSEGEGEGEGEESSSASIIRSYEEQLRFLQGQLDVCLEQANRAELQVQLLRTQKETEISQLLQHNMTLQRRVAEEEIQILDSSGQPMSRSRLEAMVMSHRTLEHRLAELEDKLAVNEALWRERLTQVEQERDELKAVHGSLKQQLESDNVGDLRRDLEAARSELSGVLQRKEQEVSRLQSQIKEINVEYMKNIVLRYLQADQDEVQESLVPVLATLFHFTPDQVTKIKEARAALTLWGKTTSQLGTLSSFSSSSFSSLFGSR